MCEFLWIAFPLVKPAVVIDVDLAAPAVARSDESAVDLLRKRLRAERGAARRCCRGGGRGRLSGYLQGCMLFDKPTKSRGSCVTRSAKNKTGFFLCGAVTRSELTQASIGLLSTYAPRLDGCPSAT